MDYSKPTLLVISGPNGAGKSTHIQSMLPLEFAGAIPFDRDKTRVGFEQQLANNNEVSDNIKEKAIEMMESLLIEKMGIAITAKAHFVLETPLSHPDYWKYIDRFLNNGYQIQLNYLCLDKIKDCALRVQQRVSEGGHFVDARTIKGVYEMNLTYINDYFATTFTSVQLYDGTKSPELLAQIENNKIVFAKEAVLQKHWIRNGLPSVARIIAGFLDAK
jgi:predicted ABC-type ATPase